MAISWGTEVKNSSGNGMRVGYEFTQSPVKVTAGTLSVTVTLKVYVWTRRSVYDSSNNFSVSGDFSWSGSANISHGNNGGTTLVRTLTRTVATSYTGTVKSSAAISLNGIAPISGTARASGAWTTSKRPINPPAAPGSVVVARSSDDRQTIGWVLNSPTNPAAPYEAQDIRRWDNVTNTWRTIATLPKGVTAYTDSSTILNRRYQYAVRATNSAGASAWADSPYISTTPTPPTSVTAQKAGSDIRLNWTNTSTGVGTAVEIWHATNGAWDSTALAVINGSPTSWVHASANPSVTHAYRLKSAAKQDTPFLYSAYSAGSNVVQLLAPPSAPSKLSPAAEAVDAADTLTMRWQHNSVDTTDQTAYEFQYRLNGGAWVGTGKRVSGTSSHALVAGTLTNGATLQWQVRTWGDFASASPWSAIAVVTLSARPAATILTPGPRVDSSQVVVQWGYFDPEGTPQTNTRLRLEDSSGSSVYSTTRSGTSTTFTIPYSVADGASYTLAVAVRDGDGVWSQEALQSFSVTYAKPPTPSIECIWDVDLGAVVITIEHPDPDTGEAAAVSAEIWRSADGGEWEVLATDLEPSTSIVDFIPALDAVNHYRVVSVSALPSFVESLPVAVVTESEGWIFVNGGPGFAQVVKIRENAKVTQSPSRVKVRNQFAGRTHLVETAGDARSRKISLSAKLGGGSSSNEAWMAMSDMVAPLCYREPATVRDLESSTRIFVGFDDYTVSKERTFQDVSMSFEQVEGV